MIDERRKRPRAPPHTLWTEDLREIVRTAVKMAVDEMLASQHNVMGDITREDHKADHEFVKGWRRFILGAKDHAASGVGEGFKQVIRIATVVIVVTVLFALFGSLLSPSWRHALGTLLTAF